VTGNQESVGIRVPDHPVAMALLSEFEEIGGLGIAAPSANVFGAVSPTTFEAVKMEIGYKLNREDLILDGGSSKVGIESTIIDCQSNDPTILRPGAITKEMIVNVLDKEVKLKIQNPFNSPVKTPGMHQSHYAPKSKVIIDGTPNLGDGFIALDSIKTPKGAIRLASPKNNEQFARELYAAFRLGDSFSLSKIIVISPVGSGIAIAINDRLKRSAFNEQL
jgi:L-threonylcarbamoyladenylate synthase